MENGRKFRENLAPSSLVDDRILPSLVKCVFNSPVNSLSVTAGCAAGMSACGFVRPQRLCGGLQQLVRKKNTVLFFFVTEI